MTIGMRAGRRLSNRWFGGSLARPPAERSGKIEGGANPKKANYTVKQVKQNETVSTDFGQGNSQDVKLVYEYPEFSPIKGNKTGKGAKALNAQLKSDDDATLQRAKAWTLDNYNANMEMQVNARSVTCPFISGSVASLRTDECSYADGAHGSESVKGSFYNLDTGKQIGFEEATGISFDSIKSEAATALRSYLSTNPPEDPSSNEEHIQKIIQNEDCYYATSDGIVVITEDYELGTYAYGRVEILVHAWKDQSKVGTDVKPAYIGNQG